MHDCVGILQDYINNDPIRIEQSFIGILYLELTGSSTSGIEVDEYFSSLIGRYKSPRMKNALGSTIEILKSGIKITEVAHLVNLMFELRGPSLTAAEFLAELVSNGFVPKNQ